MRGRRCPHCNKQMSGLVTWYPVHVGNDNHISVCKECAEEAAQIDEAYHKACMRAKGKWLRNPSIELAALLPGPPGRS